MANWNPPNKNEAFEFDITLEDYVNSGTMKTNPTLASGDFKLVQDGAAEANPATLPAVTPASGRTIRVQLTAAEMNFDRINFLAHDQTVPPEWADYSICILTTTP